MHLLHIRQGCWTDVTEILHTKNKLSPAEMTMKGLNLEQLKHKKVKKDRFGTQLSYGNWLTPSSQQSPYESHHALISFLLLLLYHIKTNWNGSKVYAQTIHFHHTITRSPFQNQPSKKLAASSNCDFNEGQGHLVSNCWVYNYPHTHFD